MILVAVALVPAPIGVALGNRALFAPLTRAR
jgi:hypothetical protein